MSDRIEELAEKFYTLRYEGESTAYVKTKAYIREALRELAAEKDMELLALQQVCEKQREALESWNHVYRETDAEYDDCNAAAAFADKVLSLQPNLSLLDEVRKALKSMADLPNYDQDNEHRLRYAAKQLLTKLGS